IASGQDVAVAHDTQAWVQFVGHIPIGSAWLVHAEAQPRWNDDVSRKDQLILRGALGRRLGRRTTVWAGHAYIPRWQGSGEVAHEQRTWQQLSVNLPAAGRWTPSIRLRPEQRFLDGWADSSHRFRAMVRAVRPIGASAWSIAASNEYFQTLDRTASGPGRGFDQNRVFGGFIRRFSPASTVEAGYLWQLVPRTSAAPRRHNHTAFVWFNYAPPVK
ncbi:MAG TPA: DUF2490 domain-containing protein, partial [Luteitalea sp.]|nr:DUF2490 domain-containing protein [Luteitalea sp.]